MKFAVLGHLIGEDDLNRLPKHFTYKNLIYSPELNIFGANGYIAGLKLTAKQLINMPIEQARQIILDAAIFLQDELNVELIQLGALTTSVTNGGEWLIDQKNYTGIFNHGDSYTSAVTCQVALKILDILEKNSSNMVLAVIGAYGIIGETVSKILVPNFKHSILIGRREEKLKELKSKIKGSYEIATKLQTKESDIIITATNHPAALLKSSHLKKNAIIVDVSQPPNLSKDVCKRRQDICRLDGGYVDFPSKCPIPIPGMPIGKNFACIVEIIMQCLEKERENHVGSIDMEYLRKTEKWAEKYGFILKELTNFGEPIEIKSYYPKKPQY